MKRRCCSPKRSACSRTGSTIWARAWRCAVSSSYVARRRDRAGHAARAAVEPAARRRRRDARRDARGPVRDAPLGLIRASEYAFGQTGLARGPRLRAPCHPAGTAHDMSNLNDLRAPYEGDLRIHYACFAGWGWERWANGVLLDESLGSFETREECVLDARRHTHLRAA